MHEASATQAEQQGRANVIVQQQPEHHALRVLMHELPGSGQVGTALLDPVAEGQVALVVPVVDADFAQIVLFAVNQFTRILLSFFHLVLAADCQWLNAAFSCRSGGDNREAEALPGLHAAPVVLDLAGGIPGTQ